jgi:diguanylate cyclase (GGDEF)-like protein
MPPFSQNLALNAELLKSTVNRYAVSGIIIALMAMAVATALSAFFEFGRVDMDAFVRVQSSNMVLWFLDAMPVVFAVWGQHIGTVLSYEAGAMVVDQTRALRDQTEALEKKAMHGATHDSLTGLPNRALFQDRVFQAIRNAKRGGHQLGILFLDLDRFKEINDTIGHYSGDRILQQVARRLGGLVRESDTLARLGGDEFGILLQSIKGRDDINIVASKIHAAVMPVFTVDTLKIDVQVSIGAVMFPEHGEDVDTLIQRVDIAMYVAKQNSREIVFYKSSMDRHSTHRLTLVSELRQAIMDDKLALYYQPKMDCRTGEITGVEALARWRHEVHGMISPDEFMPIAERTGLIQPLSSWAIGKALDQGAEWHARGMPLNIAVNLSVRNLLDPDFPDVIAGLFASQKFPPASLIIEITETTIMSDPDYALETINRVSTMGVRFAIDDFGTGYSSLSYLKKLPIHEIKIDKSFVMDMLANENDAAIVKATIDLAHNLGLHVVAEGVENRETSQVLRRLGCDKIQGFYVSKALSSVDFNNWLSGDTGPGKRMTN